MKIFVRYWIPVIFWLALIYTLSNQPAQFYPEVRIPFADKFVHVFLYAALGFVVFRALTARYRLQILWDRYRIFFVATVLVTLVYGVSDEIHQSFVPGRSVELADVIADTLGGILGAYFTVLYRRLLIRIKVSRAR